MDLSVLTRRRQVQPVINTVQFAIANSSAFKDGSPLDIIPYFTGITNPKWEEADFRICWQFLSNASTKLPSTTWSVLYNIVRDYAERKNKKIFIDFAFVPSYKADFQVYCKNDLTFPVPILSRHSLDEFDIIGISNGTSTEISALPHIYYHSGMNAFHSERLKTDEPLIFMGGQNSQNSEWVFGKVEIDGKEYQGLADAMLLGFFEPQVDPLLDTWFSFNEKFGNPKLPQNKLKFFEELYNVRMPGFAYPMGFEPVYSDWNKGIISEIKQIIPWAKVANKVDGAVRAAPQEHYGPHLEGMFQGMDQAHLSASDQSARSAEVHCSCGCSSSNACAFCSEGSTGGSWRERPIEELIASLRVARLNKPVDACTIFSYNWTYLSYYPRMVFEVAKRYGSTQFSCLYPLTKVITDQGLIPIKDVVANFSKFKVLSYNAVTGLKEFKKVLFAQRTGDLDRSEWVSIGTEFVDRSVVRSTPEHRWFTNLGEITAGQLKVEFDKGHKVSIFTGSQISKSGMSVILASLISDARWHLEGRTKRSVRFGFSGFKGAEHEWVSYKLARVEQSGLIKFNDVVAQSGNFNAQKVYVRDFTSPLLYQFYQWRQKDSEGYFVYPEEFYELFDIEALSVWFFNDGFSSYRKSSNSWVVGISAHRYSEDHFNRMAEVCRRLGFEVSVSKRDHQGAIRLSFLESTRQAFFDAISHFCSVDMEYKIPDRYRSGIAQESDNTPVDIYAPVNFAGYKRASGSYSMHESYGKFDLEVEDNHNYFVAPDRQQGIPVQYLVHNSQRADTLAYDWRGAEYQQVCDSNQITIALEGVSQRLRNYLNKSLTTEEIFTTVEQIIKNKFTEIKLYMIATGYETQEDANEFEQLLIHINRCKVKYSSATSVRMSFSPLNIVQYTPLKYERINAAYSIIKGTKQDTLGPILELGTKYRIPFRTSLHNSSVVFYQLGSSNDRRMTKALLTWCMEGTNGRITYKEIQREDQNRFIELVQKDCNVDLEAWFDEKPFDFVFPMDYLLGTFHTDFLRKTAQRIRDFKGEKYCLRTIANKDAHCYGCTRCNTKEEKELMIKHEYPDPESEEQKQYSPRMLKQIRSVVRTINGVYIIRASFPSIFRFVEHNSRAVSVVSALLKAGEDFPLTSADYQRPSNRSSDEIFKILTCGSESPNLVDIFRSVHGSTRKSASARDQTDYSHGFENVFFSTRVHVNLEYLQKLIPLANKYLPEGVSVDFIRESDQDELKLLRKHDITRTLYMATGPGWTSEWVKTRFSLLKDRYFIKNMKSMGVKVFKKVEVPFTYPVDPVGMFFSNKSVFIKFSAPTNVNVGEYLSMLATGTVRSPSSIRYQALDEYLPGSDSGKRCSVCGRPVELSYITKTSIGDGTFCARHFCSPISD